MIKIIKLTCYTLLLLVSSCKADAQKIDDFTKKIDNLVKMTNPRSFNGVVFIQQNGKVKYQKTYGFSDFKLKMPLKISDRFSTMSIAKQITATLILQEVEKGTIDLHKPIRTYLPYFQYSWADTITVHQLLNHTSGLYSDDLKPNLKFKPEQISDILTSDIMLQVLFWKSKAIKRIRNWLLHYSKSAR